jgi:cytochrome c2
MPSRTRIFYFILLWAVVAAKAESAPATAPNKYGEEVFAKRCAPCHTIGGGKKVGPISAG